MNQIEQTITTLEIAEMMGMRHDRVLRKLEGSRRKVLCVSIWTQTRV